MRILPLLSIINLVLFVEAQNREARNYRYGGEAFLKKLFLAQANCSRTDWACTESCRIHLQHNRESGLCLPPAQNENCFGIPIQYNFTRDTPQIFSVLSRYRILQKFPKCWSALGPLLCAVAYRPCTIRPYIERSMEEPGQIELWQVLRKEMCHRSLERCSFLIKEGLWPEFVNCSDTVEYKQGRQLFSDGRCKMSYNEAPSIMGKTHCIWPLADGFTHKSSFPVLDNCYIPCRTPLVSSEWVYKSFRSLLFVFASFMVIITSLCSLYLLFFSYICVKDICVYVIGHALLRIANYCFIWMLSYIDGVMEQSVCFGLQRRVLWSNTLDWCDIQSWFLTVSFLSAFYWLICFIFIQGYKPEINADHMLLQNINLRCTLIVFDILAGCFASLGLWLYLTETDGLAGVCYKGFLTYTSAAFVYLPLAFITTMFGIAISYQHIRSHRRGKKARKVESGHLFDEPRSDEPLKDEKIEMEDDHAEKNIENRSGYTVINPSWFHTIWIVTLLSLLATVVFNIRIIIGADVEQETILESVRCSLNKTLIGGQEEWLQGLRYDISTDVLTRRSVIGQSSVSAPGCELTSNMDGRLTPLFLAFLFFPSLPFITVVAFILAGFCGHGLNDVGVVKNNLNPFVLAPKIQWPNKENDQDKIELVPNIVGEQEQTHSVGQKEIRSAEHDQVSNVESEEVLVGSEKTFPNRCTASPSTSSPPDHVGDCSEESKVRRIDLRAKAAARRRMCVESGFLPQRKSARSNSAGNPGNFKDPRFPQVCDDMRRACSSTSKDACLDSQPVYQMATTFSAYQTGLVEGLWRERYASSERRNQLLLNQVRELTKNLNIAHQDLLRLRSLQDNQSEVPTSSRRTFPSSETGRPSRSGFAGVASTANVKSEARGNNDGSAAGVRKTKVVKTVEKKIGTSDRTSEASSRAQSTVISHTDTRSTSSAAANNDTSESESTRDSDEFVSDESDPEEAAIWDRWLIAHGYPAADRRNE